MPFLPFSSFPFYSHSFPFYFSLSFNFFVFLVYVSSSLLLMCRTSLSFFFSLLLHTFPLFNSAFPFFFLIHIYRLFLFASLIYLTLSLYFSPFTACFLFHVSSFSFSSIIPVHTPCSLFFFLIRSDISPISSQFLSFLHAYPLVSSSIRSLARARHFPPPLNEG